MNKKLIIQIVVIVAAFAAAGAVLYNGFKGINTVTISQNGSAFPGQAEEKILPYGSESLNSEMKRTLYSRNFQFDTVEDISLDPKVDVGVPIENLVVPLTPIKPQ